MKKAICLMLPAVCFLSVAGCDMTSAERLEVYERQLADADGRIAAIQDALAEGRAMLADVNLPADERREVERTVADTQAILAKVELWRAKVAGAVAEAKAGGSEWDVWAEGLSATGSAVGGPVGGYLALGGLVLSVIGNAFQRAKGKQTAGTLKAVVRGVEKAPEAAQEAVKGQIRDQMEAADILAAGDEIVNRLKKIA